jgi:hypothetical protein
MPDQTLVQSVQAVPQPTPWPDANRRLLLGQGAPVDPLVRLSTFTDTEFERFIWEWVNGYLTQRYVEVQARGGAGDKGRDVIGWLEDSTTQPRRWDLYQCKQYDSKLAPSDFMVELGKLCYYTHKGDYTVPQHYFIVTPLGIGNSLQDLIDDPAAMKARLIEKWDDWCKDDITKKEAVPLEGSLAKWVNEFNFSVVGTVPPPTLIEQHGKTKYHLAVFGSAFRPRPAIMAPPTSIADNELVYVQRAFEAFADHLKTPVASQKDFEVHDYLKTTFDHARECFYSAESLKEFSRDNLPDDKEYTNLCNQMLQGIRPTLNRLHTDGYEKLVDTTEKAVSVSITSNILTAEMEPSDRVGICHQLANDGAVRWVKERMKST